VQEIGCPPLLVIDGQQRLTTLTLLIEALARAVGEDEPIDGFSGPKLREYYLTSRLEKGDRYFLQEPNCSHSILIPLKGVLIFQDL